MHLIGVVGWTALVVVLIAAPLNEASHHHHEDEGEKTLMLQHRLSTLEEKLRERKGKDKLMKLCGLDSRLKHHEDDQCGENFVLCGYHTNQCVHELLVCDGVVDCDNGFDESHCEVPLHVGKTFLGEVVYDYCTKRRPHFVSVEVIKADKDSVVLKLTIDGENEEKWDGTVFEIHGTYDFGQRLAFLKPPESDGLALELDFGEYDQDGFNAYIHSEARGRCAKIFFPHAYETAAE